MDHRISKFLKPINIAAHRGSCGGNIPPNTSTAYEAALYQGAHILEADVARSADGVYYMFHTGSGNEKYYLGIDCAFEDLTSKELDEIYLNNELGKDTLYHLFWFSLRDAASSIWTVPGNTGKRLCPW